MPRMTCGHPATGAAPLLVTLRHDGSLYASGVPLPGSSTLARALPVEIVCPQPVFPTPNVGRSAPPNWFLSLMLWLTRAPNFQTWLPLILETLSCHVNRS